MNKRIVSSYWKILEGHRLKSAILIGLTTISGLLEGVAIICLVPILNSGITKTTNGPSFLEIFNFAWDPANTEKALIISLIFFIVLGICSALVKGASEIGVYHLRAEVERSFRDRLGKALLSMRWAKYMTFKMGEISNALSIEAIWIGIGAQVIINLIGLTLVCLVLWIFALGLSLKMTMLTIVFGLVAVLLGRRISSNVKKHSTILNESISSLSDSTEQYFSNLKFIKAFGLVPFVDNVLSKQGKKCANDFNRTYSLFPLVRVSYEVLGIIFIAIIVAGAYWFVPSVFGRLIAFLAIFYRIAPRLIAVQDAYNQALSHETWFLSWEKRFNFSIEHQEKSDIQQNQPIDIFNELKLEDVEFYYEERPILKKVSFNLPRGKMLALVGESGGGKTTILDLLTGLMTPQNGTVRINGIPMQDIRLDDWRKKIGLVMQNSPIFHTTVLKNITMDDPHPDLKKVEKCAKMAHAWEFIERLPEKYETQLGQKGAGLSQGEGQRLALARALYRDPWVLILDEPTSALDAQSESYILDTLKLMKGSVTILMVSHHLASANFADEILFLENGKIAERGTFRDLMSRPSGRFKSAAGLQGNSSLGY